jgi:hypothetical protein
VERILGWINIKRNTLVIKLVPGLFHGYTSLKFFVVEISDPPASPEGEADGGQETQR